MSKFKELINNPRIIILIVFLVFSLIAIKPWPTEGVSIRSVKQNSTAMVAGLSNPLSPYQQGWERIVSINNDEIKSLDDFYEITSGLGLNSTVSIQTNEKFYILKLKNSTELGIDVIESPNNNLKFGLDISGGIRVILNPVTEIDEETLNKIISILDARLNVYGLSDVDIRPAIDLSGETYIVVEIAGATRNEVEDLLASQGKFEAKIGNSTVFVGGDDISYVCQSADCTRITCSKSGSENFCQFSFSLTISQEAARRFADATGKLPIDPENPGYLSEEIVFYLDGNEYSSLQISSDLKGQAQTDVSISGSGAGNTQNDARADARSEMQKLQTVLTVGSLPVDLETSKIDEISSSFGKEFLNNAALVGLFALLTVALVLFIRYKNPIVSLGIFFTMLSEIIILLGFASFTGWNLDLIAIAGIIVAVGTGVDDQIVITDEILRNGLNNAHVSWKEKIKKAFFVMFGSYATTVVAMLPLMFAGVGLLKGFAFTTIVGVTAGVFITRPAYAKFVEKML